MAIGPPVRAEYGGEAIAVLRGVQTPFGIVEAAGGFEAERRRRRGGGGEAAGREAEAAVQTNGRRYPGEYRPAREDTA